MANREHDSLSAYLDEIGRYPLCTRADEVRLALRIRAGDRSAIEALVCSNLRFVVVIAKQYQHRGVALSDLIEEGNLGLVRAAERFDEGRGVKFISYAVWWIRQAILQAIADQGQAMRVPAGRARMLRRIGYESNQLGQLLGREPTARELAEALGMTEEEITAAQPIAGTAVSLDAPLGADQDSQLLEILVDEDATAPDEATADADLAEAIGAAMTELRGREAEVLALHFGLGGDEPRTLEEIGSRYGITRERVRQIKDKALLRIRRSKRGRVLEQLR